MHEALERAQHDLVFLQGLRHSDGDSEPFDIDVSLSLRWIEAALHGLPPLDLKAGAEPPE